MTIGLLSNNFYKRVRDSFPQAPSGGVQLKLFNEGRTRAAVIKATCFIFVAINQTTQKWYIYKCVVIGGLSPPFIWIKKAVRDLFE